MNRRYLKELEQRVAERVKEARKDIGLSQEEMGERLGLTKVGYGHYERGTHPFTVSQLFWLSPILGKSVSHLLGIDAELTEEEQFLIETFRAIRDKGLREVVVKTAITCAQTDRGE